MKRHSPGRSPTRQHPAYMYRLVHMAYPFLHMVFKQCGLSGAKACGIGNKACWGFTGTMVHEVGHMLLYNHALCSLIQCPPCTPIQCPPSHTPIECPTWVMHTHPMPPMYTHPMPPPCTPIQCPHVHPSNVPMYTHPMPPCTPIQWPPYTPTMYTHSTECPLVHPSNAPMYTHPGLWSDCHLLLYPYGVA